MKKWQLVLCSIALGVFLPLSLAIWYLIGAVAFLGFHWLPVLLFSVAIFVGLSLSINYYKSFKWTTE